MEEGAEFIVRCDERYALNLGKRVYISMPSTGEAAATHDNIVTVRRDRNFDGEVGEPCEGMLFREVILAPE